LLNYVRHAELLTQASDSYSLNCLEGVSYWKLRFRHGALSETPIQTYESLCVSEWG
jgi:hypothetical protein